MWETLDMDECTWRALVCVYWTRPKAAPTAQSRMPRYISVTPLMPPKPSKRTCVRSGILISASPARSAEVKDAAKVATPSFQGVRSVIEVEERLGVLGMAGGFGGGARGPRVNYDRKHRENAGLSEHGSKLIALKVAAAREACSTGGTHDDSGACPPHRWQWASHGRPAGGAGRG